MKACLGVAPLNQIELNQIFKSSLGLNTFQVNLEDNSRQFVPLTNQKTLSLETATQGG